MELTEKALIAAISQVPALVVLGWIVWKFLSKMETRDTQFHDTIKSISNTHDHNLGNMVKGMNETIGVTNISIRDNSKVIGENSKCLEDTNVLIEKNLKLLERIDARSSGERRAV